MKRVAQSTYKINISNYYERHILQPVDLFISPTLLLASPFPFSLLIFQGIAQYLAQTINSINSSWLNAENIIQFLYKTFNSAQVETVDTCMRHQQMNAYGLSQQEILMEHPVWIPKSSPFQYCVNEQDLLGVVEKLGRVSHPREVFGT